jgi:hypothetical protein
MIQNLPEINPLDLLYNPYKPITEEDLADLMGVSECTVESWIKRKRNPSKTAKILAAILLEQWRSQPKAT